MSTSNSKDSTPREELEVRAVAMLLGEASDSEAVEICKAIDADPELKAYHAEMQRVIQRLEEPSRENSKGSSPAGLKLSAERREQLEALFKCQPAPRIQAPASRPIRGRAGKWQIALALAAALALVGVFVGGLLPESFKLKTKPQFFFVADAERFAVRVPFVPKAAQLRVEPLVMAGSARQGSLVSSSRNQEDLRNKDKDKYSFESQLAGSGGLSDAPRSRGGPKPTPALTAQPDPVPAYGPNAAREQEPASVAVRPDLSTRTARSASARPRNTAQTPPPGSPVLPASLPEIAAKSTTTRPLPAGVLLANRPNGERAPQIVAGQGAQGLAGASGIGDGGAVSGVTPTDASAGIRFGPKASAIKLEVSAVGDPAAALAPQIPALAFKMPLAESALTLSRATDTKRESLDEKRVLQRKPAVALGKELALNQNAQDVQRQSQLDGLAPVAKGPVNRPISQTANRVEEMPVRFAEEKVAGRELAEQFAKISLSDSAVEKKPQGLLKLESDDRQSLDTPPDLFQPLPEVNAEENRFSTFSLNVSQVSFELAAAALESGAVPVPGRIRSEEFVNAFDYRDPAPGQGQKVAFAWDRVLHPFAHDRELLRFSVQTAAAGREPGKTLNLVLLLDNSGSMERADRVRLIEEMVAILANQLQPQDRVSVITFARTASLRVDGMTGGNPEELIGKLRGLSPQGGTNLEEAMALGYETALKYHQPDGNNRVILLTDGAANLGNVDPAVLRERVAEHRRRGIALDCFGIGWDGFNDSLLEQLSRHGDGRYGFINHPTAARDQFGKQLMGAFQVAAADVKVQIEFNPKRVSVHRQIGYQQHQLAAEQFRDNTVDAAEIGAAETGTALYSVQINPAGAGPIGSFRVRFRVPATGRYEEKEWALPYVPNPVEIGHAAPAMRLATAAALFAESLANSPYAREVTSDAVLGILRGVPETFEPDQRPARLVGLIQRARAISGR